jgi:hypothetical protein
MFFFLLASLAMGLFHICKLKPVECGEDQDTATGRKFDVSEKLSNLIR